MKLTIKQQRFVDFYDGNATDAARKAGYKGNENTLNQVGLENLRKPNILHAIKNREKEKNKLKILTRQERQEFWTKVINGEITDQVVIGRGDDRAVIDVRPKLIDRLKASELLGRSQADFTDILKHKGSIGMGVAAMTEKEVDKELESLKD